MNVQLWLEGEEPFIDIRLAEVKKVYEHWVAVEVIKVSPSDRMRLKRFIDAPAAMYIDEPALIDLTPGTIVIHPGERPVKPDSTR